MILNTLESIFYRLANYRDKYIDIQFLVLNIQNYDYSYKRNEYRIDNTAFEEIMINCSIYKTMLLFTEKIN